VPANTLVSVTGCTRWAAAAVLVAILGAAACSGGDSDDGVALEDSDQERTTESDTTEPETSDAEPTKEEVAAALGQGATGVSDEDAMCLGLAIVDAVGFERLVDAGAFDENSDVTLSDLGITLDDGQTATLLDGLHRCGDLRAMFKSALSANGTMSPEAASCVVDGLDDASFDRLLVLSISGGEAALDADPDLTSAMQDAVLTCLATGIDV
jgi:hypothetical protein